MAIRVLCWRYVFCAGDTCSAMTFLTSASFSDNYICGTFGKAYEIIITVLVIVHCWTRSEKDTSNCQNRIVVQITRRSTRMLHCCDKPAAQLILLNLTLAHEVIGFRYGPCLWDDRPSPVYDLVYCKPLRHIPTVQSMEALHNNTNLAYRYSLGNIPSHKNPSETRQKCGLCVG